MTTPASDVVRLCPHCWGDHEQNIRHCADVAPYDCLDCDRPYPAPITVTLGQAEALTRAITGLAARYYGRFLSRPLTDTTRLRLQLKSSGWRFPYTPDLAALASHQD